MSRPIPSVKHYHPKRREKMRPDVILSALLIFLPLIAGCVTARADEQPQVKSIDSSPGVEADVILDLQREARREFSSAHYAKPDLPALGDPSDVMAPLIVYEARKDGTGATDNPLGFGVVFVDDEGKLLVDASQPTVYTDRRTVEHGGRTWDQLGCFWWYAGDDQREPITMQGIVMTLDEGGFPFLWEPVTATKNVRALFVSKDFEAHAAIPAASAPSGRSKQATADVSRQGVVQVTPIETTPVPTGPYVYLNTKRQTTSILCRCSAVQADEFITENEYDLRPLGELEAGSLTWELLGLSWRDDEKPRAKAEDGRAWTPLIPDPPKSADASP